LLYHEAVTPISRFGASGTPALAARRAEKAYAPPASCNRLQRIAHQLSHKKKFDHSQIHRPLDDRWGGICE
jgi:hypothetical protein